MDHVIIYGLSSVILAFGALSTQLGLSQPSGCEGRGEIRSQVNAPKQGDDVVVVGVLTDEGVECLALRGDDGTLYTLTGKLKKFQVGDRVRVVGQVAEFSFCQQGITINVTSIKKAFKKA
jgi:hypothetical protein